MSKKRAHNLIAEVIKEKSCLKQDVFQNMKAVFELFKAELKKTIEELEKKFESIDDRISFYYKEKNEFEVEVKIAGDVLVFSMHTNVFKFDLSNSIWKTSYLKKDEQNGYVGSISIYNFLADSIKYNRTRDIGYLIARVFVNRENKFIVQGKRQLGLLYNDFEKTILEKDIICDIIDSIILYTLSFDLYTPPYQRVQEVTVGEYNVKSQDIGVTTGKRLGFKFSTEIQEK